MSGSEPTGKAHGRHAECSLWSGVQADGSRTRSHPAWAHRSASWHRTSNKVSKGRSPKRTSRDKDNKVKDNKDRSKAREANQGRPIRNDKCSNYPALRRVFLRAGARLSRVLSRRATVITDHSIQRRPQQSHQLWRRCNSKRKQRRRPAEVLLRPRRLAAKPRRSSPWLEPTRLQPQFLHIGAAIVGPGEPQRSQITQL